MKIRNQRLSDEDFDYLEYWGFNNDDSEYIMNDVISNVFNHYKINTQSINKFLYFKVHEKYKDRLLNIGLPVFTKCYSSGYEYHRFYFDEIPSELLSFEINLRINVAVLPDYVKLFKQGHNNIIRYFTYNCIPKECLDLI